MVQVSPFRGIHPKNELASRIAVLPYDVIDITEARKEARDNPYSFYHIDRAEVDLPESCHPYDKKVYQKAQENLTMFLKNGWLVEEEEPVYFLYELQMNGKSQTGIVATTSIQEYLEGKIKKHELTRPDKEMDRINHFFACDADTSPVFLSYPKKKELHEILSEWKKSHESEINFEGYYGVRHRIWKLDESYTIKKIEELFQTIDYLYIADGHHRTASAVKVGVKKRKQKNATPESEKFLSILFPEDELQIYEYNRLMKEPPPIDFMEQLEENFLIEAIDYRKPAKKGEIMMYTNKNWYLLTERKEVTSENPVDCLDVSFLQKWVIEKIFKVEDVRTDTRIAFVGGIHGSQELIQKVDSKEAQIAFELYPTSMTDLMKVARRNQMMPPKSTWFEPKLLSGLFLYSLKSKDGYDQ